MDDEVVARETTAVSRLRRTLLATPLAVFAILAGCGEDSTDDGRDEAPLNRERPTQPQLPAPDSSERGDEGRE